MTYGRPALSSLDQRRPTNTHQSLPPGEGRLGDPCRHFSSAGGCRITRGVDMCQRLQRALWSDGRRQRTSSYLMLDQREQRWEKTRKDQWSRGGGKRGRSLAPLTSSPGVTWNFFGCLKVPGPYHDGNMFYFRYTNRYTWASGGLWRPLEAKPIRQ